MTWDILNIIGTIAFAVSGAIIAMYEDYDILGVLVLGFTTAFGGSTIRNLLLGVPVESIWMQETLFIVIFVLLIGLFLLPYKWLLFWNKWNVLFDAIGLAAFSIQGALTAMAFGAPLIAVVVAAILTGSGGGVIRDIFAGRKPLIFRKEIYALWAAVGGLCIGLGFISGPWLTGGLFVVIVGLRMLSVQYDWHLPRKSLS